VTVTVYQTVLGHMVRELQGKFASLDRIHMRHLRYLQTNGMIEEPDEGWLQV
jgi:hypothetical protein